MNKNTFFNKKNSKKTQKKAIFGFTFLGHFSGPLRGVSPKFSMKIVSWRREISGGAH